TRNYSVIIYTYENEWDRDRIWKFERNDDGSYKITNMYLINEVNKCLEVENGANADGADVIVNAYDGSNKQKWYIYSYNGNYVFKADCSDRVLDVAESGIDDRTNVQTNTFSGANNQQFTIEMVYGYEVDLGAEFYARIDCLHTNTNKYLALYGKDEDYSVIIYSNHDNDDKYWKFERYDDGSYKITNMYNINGKYKCLEVKGGANAAGTDAIVNTDDNGSDKQRWYIYSYNGNYVLKSACSECVLEVGPKNTANIENVQMGIFSGQTYQTFSIKKVTPPQESEITPVTSDAIKFQLFNYSTDKTNNINKIGGLQSNDFRKLSNYFCFLSSGYGPPEYQNNWKTYDDIDFNPNHATVERTLLNNYPVLDLTRDVNGEKLDPGLAPGERSLAYLFGGESNNTAVQSYSPKNTILQTTVKDGVTHYYYSSRQNLLEAASANAVDYDFDSNEFRIRSYTDKNKNNNYEESFLPFNSSYYNTEVNDGNNLHVITDPDYAFGMRMDVDFVQSAGGKLSNNQDMEFKFAGDDDIWVFIDDVLVLDLGGGHGPVTGSINFANGKVIASGYGNTYETTIKDCFEAVKKSGSVNTYGIFNDYTTHKLSLFYLERGGAGANCCMDFNMPTMPDGSLAVAKDVVSSSKADLNSDDTAEYTFRLSKDGADITDYELENITKNKKDGTIETVNGKATAVDDADDYYEFTLQGGESIYFTKLDEKFKYKIEEITTGQTFIKSTSSEIIGTDTGDECNSTVVKVSPSKTASKTVHFTNEVESLTVKLNYYDRTVENGKPADISEKPATFTQKYLGAELYDVNGKHKDIASMIVKSAVTADSKKPIDNIIDTYSIWGTQQNAVDVIKTFDNPHTNKKYTGTGYHTDRYGNEPNSGEKWITYYGADDKEITSESDAIETPQNVYSVNVWLYNEPKKYTVTPYQVQSENDINKTSIGNDLYVAINESKPIYAYYNQRLGEEIGNDPVDGATSHLDGYGIKGYTGTKLDTKAEVNGYKFAYWAFDSAGKEIASTDIRYNYRITSDIKLYAIYSKSTYSGSPGLTVSKNNPDVFIDEKGVSKTRLNTMMNPYNCDDCDKNISQASIIYVLFNQNDDLSKLNDQIGDTGKTYLDILREDIKGILDNGNTSGKVTVIDVEKTATGFTYHVQPADGTGTGIKLTNKNRLQFSTTFTTSALKGKRLLAFAAMYRNGNWIVSDNCIDYNYLNS
ncbi:MAG: RICIN domain-containing protein, partial [Oscillospiraceae bacterium]|nr:RICIN domain-containing protein [Oscillospiraceae bacterium]